jgi:hypothetical protein
MLTEWVYLLPLRENTVEVLKRMCAFALVGKYLIRKTL